MKSLLSKIKGFDNYSAIILIYGKSLEEKEAAIAKDELASIYI